MKLPRVRFTVRRLMVATAIVACIVRVGVELEPRRARFVRRAVGCLRRENLASSSAFRLRESGDPSYFRAARRAEFYGRLREKYELAAEHPWLPVWPDPPAPE